MSRGALGVVVVALLAPSAAGADKAPPGDDGISIAVGMNLPFFWRIDPRSIAGSVHVGVGRHHAVRGTLASNPYMRNLGATLIELAGNLDAEGPAMSGTITEVGVGYQYYPRSQLRGPLLEAGVFRRHIDGAEDYRFDTPEYMATDTVGYGVRGHIGWSWRFWGDYAFIATAFGLGMARHSGSETTSEYSVPREERTQSVTRYVPSAEFYLRVGAAVDLF